MTFKISRTTLRFADRDVVVVTIDGKRQGFYRSSGRNSGLPGEWLPFDGLALNGWFDKSRFIRRDVGEIWLHRFGTPEMMQLSADLAPKLSKRRGVESSAYRVNRFLRYEPALGYARQRNALKRLMEAA